MNFESEAIRLSHPQAGLIPKSIFRQYFNESLDDEFIQLMQEPRSTLIDVLAPFEDASFDMRLKCWLCIVLSLPPNDTSILNKVSSFLKIDSNEQFMMAARMGRIDILNQCLEHSGIDALEMIQADDYAAFRVGASGGHLNVIERLLEIIPESHRQEMIESHDFGAFISAASGGHLNVMNKIMQTSLCFPWVMIQADNYAAIKRAAGNGHHNVIKILLKELSDDKKKEMLNRYGSMAFYDAALGGHLNTMGELMLGLSDRTILEMIKKDDYKIFKMVASRGHLNVIKMLIEFVSGDNRREMIQAQNYNALDMAARGGHLNITKMLLTFPSVLAHAEEHQEKYAHLVTPFIAEMISVLQSRQEMGHQGVVLTKQEAQRCFYMLRYLIRKTPPSPENLRHIEFLISIPAVQSLLHRYHCDSGTPNELLRLATHLNNCLVVDRLLAIPEVMAQAERDGFYQEEARGHVDLRVLAQNRESSMLALSPQEQVLVGRLEKKYGHSIIKDGSELAFNQFYDAIRRRYDEHPARFTRESGEVISLPLSNVDFVSLSKIQSFTEADEREAFKAYYQHSTHTAFRYLSKPNQWMATNSSYVEIDPVTGLRWSTFEEYKSMIALLWQAASDSHEPATEGFTLETRIEELIQEIALIGRAHNWDHTREKIDTNGQPVLNVSGKPVQEEYDDLEGDKPSCYSGVKRRLFHALKGHPLFSDVQSAIQLALKDRVRDYMAKHFHGVATDILEDVYIDYMKQIQGEPSGGLNSPSQLWNASEETLHTWKEELQNQYGPFFGKEETDRFIELEINDLLKHVDDRSHFSAWVTYAQLDVLVQKELKTREDSLEKMIEEAASQEELLTFLKKTNNLTGESKLKNAIYLGLMGKIGEQLGREAFTLLICPDANTAQVYADLLSAYDDVQLNHWLSILDETNKSMMMEKIHEFMVVVYTPTLTERLITFLRNLENNSVNELFKSVSKLSKEASTKELERVLNDWLAKNPALDISPDIYAEAEKLGLSMIRTAAEAAISTKSKMEESRATPITYEDLPDDPTGKMLTELEARINASPINPARDYRSRLVQQREQQPSDTGNFSLRGL